MKKIIKNTNFKKTYKKYIIPITGALVLGIVAVVVGLSFPALSSNQGNTNAPESISADMRVELQSESSLTPSNNDATTDTERAVVEGKAAGLTERAILQTINPEDVFDVEDSGQPKTYDRNDYARQVADKTDDEADDKTTDDTDDKTADDPSDKTADDSKTVIDPSTIVKYGDSEYDDMCVSLTATFLSTPSNAPEAYTVYQWDATAQKGTMTFYYDENKETHQPGYVFPVPDNTMELPEWRGVGDTDQSYNCYNVVFDTSFINYKPVSCYGWFKSFTEHSTFTKFSGMENLDTSNVTNFTSMFDGCAFVTSGTGADKDIDFSYITTTSDKKKKMACMFANCQNLIDINLDKTKFDTSKATILGGMFTGTPCLDKIDGSLISLEGMTSDPSTAYYAGINRMFYNCTYVHEFDLSTWGTKTGDILTGNKFIALFDGCTGINSLLLSKDWKIPFHRGKGGCYLNKNIINQTITNYNYDYCVKNQDGSSFFDYADIGETPDTTTLKPEMFESWGQDVYLIQPYVEDLEDSFGYSTYLNGTLTFHTDKDLYKVKGAIFGDFKADNGYLSAPWTFNSDLFNTLVKVEFDENYTFSGTIRNANSLCSTMPNLQSIDLSKLDFTNCQQFKYMFNNCISLVDVNFSNTDRSLNSFKSGSDFTGMFEGSSLLETVNFPNAIGVERQYVYFTDMFNGCESLQSYAVGTNVNHWGCDMSRMFKNCRSMTTLDMTKVNVNEAYIAQAFMNCTSLQTLNLPKNIFLNYHYFITYPGSSVMKKLPPAQMGYLIQNFSSQAYNFAPFYGASVSGNVVIPRHECDDPTDPCAIYSMDGLFFGCTIEGDLDFTASNIDFSKNKDMDLTFCQAKINHLKLPANADFSNVINMNMLFYGFESHPAGESPEVEGQFDFSMFNFNFNTDESEESVDIYAYAMMTDMSIKNIILPSWYFQAQSIFIYQVPNNPSNNSFSDPLLAEENTLGDHALKANQSEIVILDDEDTYPGIVDARSTEHLYPFYANTSLVTIDIGNAMQNYDLYEGKYYALDSMFRNCTNLTTIYATTIPTFNDSEVLYVTSVFSGCSNLVGADGTTIANAEERGITPTNLSGFQVDAYNDGGSAGFLTPRPNTVEVKFVYNANDDVTVSHVNSNGRKYKDRQYINKGDSIVIPTDIPKYNPTGEVGQHFEIISENPETGEKEAYWYTEMPTDPQGPWPTDKRVLIGSKIENIQEDLVLYAHAIENPTATIKYALDPESSYYQDLKVTMPDPVTVNVLTDSQGNPKPEEYELVDVPDIQYYPDYLGRGILYEFLGWYTNNGEYFYGYNWEWDNDFGYHSNGHYDIPVFPGTTTDVTLYAKIRPMYDLYDVRSIETVSTPSSGKLYPFKWNAKSQTYTNTNSWKGLSMARTTLGFKFIGISTAEEEPGNMNTALVFEGDFSGAGSVHAEFGVDMQKWDQLPFYDPIDAAFIYDDAAETFEGESLSSGNYGFGFIWGTLFSDSSVAKIVFNGRNGGQATPVMAMGPCARPITSTNKMVLLPSRPRNRTFSVTMVYSKNSPQSYFTDSLTVKVRTFQSYWMDYYNENIKGKL